MKRKRIKYLMRSRTLWIGCCIAAHMAIILWAIFAISKVWNAFYLVIHIVNIVLLIQICANDRLTSGYRAFWLSFMILIPIFSPFFYLIWGKYSLRAKGIEVIKERNGSCMEKVPLELAEAGEMRYLLEEDADTICSHTKAAYFPWGEEFLLHLLDNLQKAKRFIFLEYFIIERGEMWDCIEKVLEKKVKEGVEVRILYDSFGCTTTLPESDVHELTKKGIICKAFNPFRLTSSLSKYYMIINRRDHRKLTIIDGQVGYSGGLNLADEYINKNSPYGKWKDTGYCPEGHAVDYMTKAFLEMWNLDSTVREDTKNYLGAKGREGEGLIQPYFSSPTDGRFTAEGAYLTLIHQSKKYIHIITPYLIIDDTMISALCLAAKSGVEVVIITPGIPDKKMVYLVTKSYYPVLLEAGVRIYEYTPGFTHAKMCVSDGKIAIVGSVNLDYRSLYQHYEGGCVFYHNKIVNEVESDLQDVIKECHMVSREEIEKERKSVRILQKVLRLIAPVM